MNSAPSPTLVQTLTERYFECESGTLVLDGCPLTRLADEYGTPLYVYSERILKATWEQLRRTYPQDVRIYYSMKANPHFEFLNFFVQHGCGLEIASSGELRQAIAAGCAAQDLIYAGPGKTDDELALAIASGIGEIHAESWGELVRIDRLAQSHHVRAPIALRVNPHLQSSAGALQMGGRPSQFGIDEDQLPEVIDATRHLAAVELRGLHLNTGTQILNVDVLLDYYRHAIALVDRVAEQWGGPLSTLDFGGGLGIPYYAGQEPLDLPQLALGLHELIHELRGNPRLASTTLMVEPGRYLVGPAGCYLMRVIDIKTSRGEVFAIADGGMHQHAAATGNFGQTLKRPYPIAVANREHLPLGAAVNLVGPLCTPLDTFGRQLPLGGLVVGDLLVVLQSGAYARAASPLHFLGHATPAEVWVADGQSREIRRRGQWQDALRDQIIDQSLLKDSDG